MKKFLLLVMAALMAFPMTAFAATSEEAMMAELQKQIAELSEELEELSDRLDDTERHSTLDRIEFSGDLRARAHSLHYQDVTFNPGIDVDFTDFFFKAGAWMSDIPPGSGAALNTLFSNLAKNDPEMFNLLNSMMGSFDPNDPSTYPGVGAFRLAKAPTTYDINNDILYDSRLRLNMKAKVWDNVKFNGRLVMYKNWGDSTDSKVFDSWNSFTMDATNSGNTTGDYLRVDRAYFDWSNIANSGFYLSVGRRPSTYGPPTHFRENEMRGGTPTGNVMNLNFDGITIGRNIEDWTGIEGMVARFCYGQGFESEWGNGELFNNYNAKTKDTHFAGFNFDIYNDGTNFLQVTAFNVQDLNDGFKGTIAFPTEFGQLFAPTLYSDMQKFPTFNFVTRVQPSTTIGDMNLAGLVFSREEENGINWFVSGGWTQMRPNGEAGMFGGMGSDAVFQAKLSDDGSEIYMEPTTAGEDKNRDGYGFYTGVQVPAPMGKFGIEYNYGSKYWTPFTQVQDDPIGSKLMTRGHAGEAYYIVDVNPRMFLKFSGIYYDFEYTGSGSPVGMPKDVDDVKDGKEYSLLPAIDTAYNLNATVTVQF